MKKKWHGARYVTELSKLVRWALAGLVPKCNQHRTEWPFQITRFGAIWWEAQQGICFWTFMMLICPTFLFLHLLRLCCSTTSYHTIPYPSTSFAETGLGSSSLLYLFLCLFPNSTNMVAPMWASIVGFATVMHSKRTINTLLISLICKSINFKAINPSLFILLCTPSAPKHGSTI